jgi:hypothetical protein
VNADLANPWLAWAHYLAHRRAEARGWTRRVRFGVQRGLVIVLSHHAEGDTVRYSEMFPVLRSLDIGAERVAEVLDEMGVLVDDRRPAFEDWLDRKLDGLAPGISRGSRRGSGRCTTEGRAPGPATGPRATTT